jgi:hypothetical protein
MTTTIKTIQRIPGYTIVDAASGLVCAFRRTHTKIYDLVDRYSPRSMMVHFGQFSTEEIAQFMKSEASRGPIGIISASLSVYTADELLSYEVESGTFKALGLVSEIEGSGCP